MPDGFEEGGFSNGEVGGDGWNGMSSSTDSEERESRKDRGPKSWRNWFRDFVDPKNGDESSDDTSRGRSASWEAQKNAAKGVRYTDERSHYCELTFMACLLSDVDEVRGEQKKEIREQAREADAQLDEAAQREIGRIDSEIKDIQSLLQSEREERKELLQRKKNLEEKKKEAENHLDTESDSLDQVYVDLSTKRRELLHGAHDKDLAPISAQVETIRKLQNDVLEHRERIHDKLKTSGEKCHENLLKASRGFKTRLEDELSLIRRYVLNLRSIGLTRTVAFTLLQLGWVAVIAAGWFFSVFAVSMSMARDDWASFFVTRAAAFGEHLGSMTGGGVGLLLASMGVWILIIVAISLLFWLVDYIRDRLDRREQAGRQVVTQSRSKEGDVTTQIITETESSPQGLRAWLDVMPYVLIGGIIFILLSAGVSGGSPADGTIETVETQVRDVTTSLFGQIVGALIALVFAGLMILYRSLVVTGKMDQADAFEEGRARSYDKRQWSRSVYHMELFVASVIFIGLAIVGSVTISEGEGLFPFLAFVAMVMAAGITLGYGHPARAAFERELEIESRLAQVSRLLDMPVPHYATSDMTNTVGQVLEEGLNEFAESLKERRKILLSLPSTLVAEILRNVHSNQRANADQSSSDSMRGRSDGHAGDDAHSEGEDSLVQRFLAFVTRPLHSDQEEKTPDPDPSFSSIEELYYPELIAKKRKLDRRCKALRREILDLQDEIAEVERKKDEISEASKERIETLERRLDDAWERRGTVDSDLRRLKHRVRRLQQHREKGVDDGCSRALHYRVHDKP